MLKYVWYNLLAKPAMMITLIEIPVGLAMFAARAAAKISARCFGSLVSDSAIRE